MPQPDTPAPPVSPFQALLDTAEEGVLRDELDQHLRAIVGQLHDQHRTSGGKPKAAITLAVGLTLDSGVIEVMAKVKVEMPKPARRKSIFFRGPGDTLSRQNQQQTALELRDVSTGETPLRRA